VFVKNVRLQMMYRAEFIFTILGSLLSIYVQIAIWQALLAQSPELSPIPINAMITYVIIFYVIRQASHTNFFSVMAQKVNRGDIAVDLIRPVNLKNMLLSEQASENVCTIIFSIAPVAVLASVFWGFELLASPAALAIFIPTAILAIILTFYITYIFSLLIFWTREQVYPRQICGGLLLIFSGSAVPLWFYPQWLQTLGMFLPFRLMGFESIQIFMGLLDIQQAVMVLAHQILWLGGLWLLERFIWSRIKNNVFVQGG